MRFACLLPPLSKKVIYLDQMAISNMMKAIHPDTPATTLAKLDPFWLEAYKKLDVVCRLQLAVCPSSDFHRRESQLWGEKFEPLREMYRHLSGGVSFADHLTIQRFQVEARLLSTLTGDPFDSGHPAACSVFYGEVHGWWNRVRISVNLNYDPAWIEEYAANRERVRTGLESIFARWRSDKHKSFDDWYREEAAAFGPSIFQAYQRRVAGILAARLHGQAITLDDLMDWATTVMTTLRSICIEHGVSAADVPTYIREYLHSDAILELPFNRISSLIWAAIARKAAAGQKAPPNEGMATDVDLISCHLPYCDAMFVDNACRAYLAEEPVAGRLGYNTRIYSQRTIGEFLAYLDEIRNAPPPYVVECAKDLYGPDCEEPFTELYARR
ncbi:MAG: hypothetical protein ABIK96_03015 [bacterium]